MTFEEYYKLVTEKAKVTATKDYVRLLWSLAYTIEQAIHNLQTMREGT